MAHQLRRKHDPLSARSIVVLALLLAGFTFGLYMLADAMNNSHFFDGDPGRAAVMSTQDVRA